MQIVIGIQGVDAESIPLLYCTVVVVIVLALLEIDSESLGQYSISKPFPFYILITILIQATEAGRST